MGSPARVVARTCSAESFESLCFWSGVAGASMRGIPRFAQFPGEFPVEFRGIPAGACHHLGGQQVHDDAVLIRGPHRAIPPQKRSTRAFFAAEPERPVQQSVDKPLEADRHFDEPPLKFRGNAINDAAADQRFPDAGASRPAWTMGEEIGDGRGQVMVGVHEAGRAGHDAMPVVVRVIAEGDVKAVLERDEIRHRIGG